MKDKRVMKYLIGLFKTHKKELIIIMTIAALGSLMTVAVPYIYGRLFDLAILPKTTTTLLLSLMGLWAILTLISNYISAKTSALGDIVKAAKAANAHDFIMKTTKKYETLVGERGVKLSVGQKQRIAITMAFLKNPKILIMDEPTASLDAKSESKVQEGIKKLIQKRTTIIIAHRFSTVKSANKIVVLDKGKITEIGNHNQLMRMKGKYYELYNLQRGLD